MDTSVPQTIGEETIRDRIVEACHPEAIILFGSAARAETRPGSDLDLLVIMELPQGRSNRDQVRALSDLFPRRRIPMDILVLTPEQYREGQRLLGHVARVASRDGIRLYG